MHLFRTAYTINNFPFALSHNDQFLLLGSCFSDNIGKKLISHGFLTLINPGGIVYNPISLENSLSKSNSFGTINDSNVIFKAGNRWKSLYHHSSFSFFSRELLLEEITKAHNRTIDFLKKSPVIIITFGTTLTYTHKKSDIIVSNCHKLPAEFFSERYLSHKEVTDSIQRICSIIGKINPKSQIIFTISPVLHLRDGLEANMRSKATLLSAVHEQCDHLINAHYFAAYDIVTQDLRDYRFYADDMVHPSQEAVTYIWEIFQKSLLTPESVALASSCYKLYNRLMHTPGNCDSTAYNEFQHKTVRLYKKMSGEVGHELFTKQYQKFLNQTPT